jgi:hypothetical protein
MYNTMTELSFKFSYYIYDRSDGRSEETKARADGHIREVIGKLDLGDLSGVDIVPSRRPYYLNVFVHFSNTSPNGTDFKTKLLQAEDGEIPPPRKIIYGTIYGKNGERELFWNVYICKTRSEQAAAKAEKAAAAAAAFRPRIV